MNIPFLSEQLFIRNGELVTLLALINQHVALLNCLFLGLFTSFGIFFR